MTDDQKQKLARIIISAELLKLSKVAIEANIDNSLLNLVGAIYGTGVEKIFMEAMPVDAQLTLMKIIAEKMKDLKI